MGQYHVLANLDKREFVHPHHIGLGLKMAEQLGFEGSMGDILYALVACSHERGGGDIRDSRERLQDFLGRWTGDRVAVIGDYSEPTDIPGVDAHAIYRLIAEQSENAAHERGFAMRYGDEDFVPNVVFEGEEWTDIAPLVEIFLEDYFGITVTGKGWRNRTYLNSDEEPERPMAPDMVLRY